MLGNRMSVTPFSVYCGGVAGLSAKHGAGRPAAMSKAAHAKFAGAPEAHRLLSMLSDEERRIVESWQTPTTLVYSTAVMLDYESAEKEVELGLDEYGNYAAPEDARCISVGHMDMGWIKEVPLDDTTSMRVAFAADIKKTSYTVQEGAESLQLHAYGFAYASKNDCHAYCPGLWFAEEGHWQWASEMVVPYEPRGLDLWERLYHAIMNTNGEFNTGVHCRGCYQRLHCPEHAMALASIDHWSAVDMTELDAQGRGALLLKVQAASEMLDKMKGNLQELARRGVEVRADGKRYLPIQMPGRKSLDQAKLQDSLGPELEKFYKIGAPYDQFRWKKDA